MVFQMCIAFTGTNLHSEFISIVREAVCGIGIRAKSVYVFLISKFLAFLSSYNLLY